MKTRSAICTKLDCTVCCARSLCAWLWRR